MEEYASQFAFSQLQPSQVGKVSGTELFKELLKDADSVNEGEMPVMKTLDTPSGGSIKYIRYDAVIKKLNDINKRFVQILKVSKGDLRDKFFKECTDNFDFSVKTNLAPHDLFEWFWKNLNNMEIFSSEDMENFAAKMLLTFDKDNRRTLAEELKILIQKDISPSPIVLPSDEIMLDFIDWFGTWQTDKNIDHYGINDILDDYKKFASYKEENNKL